MKARYYGLFFIVFFTLILCIKYFINEVTKGPTWCDCKRWHEKENVVAQYGKMPSNFTLLPMPEPEEYADWARCYEKFIKLEDAELNKWKINTDCK